MKRRKYYYQVTDKEDNMKLIAETPTLALARDAARYYRETTGRIAKIEQYVDYTGMGCW